MSAHIFSSNYNMSCFLKKYDEENIRRNIMTQFKTITITNINISFSEKRQEISSFQIISRNRSSKSLENLKLHVIVCFNAS